MRKCYMGRPKLTDEEKAERKKAKQVEENATKSQDGFKYKELTDYIQSLYVDVGYQKRSIPWALISSQIKNIKAEYGVNYSAIRYTLWYMKNIEEVDLFSDKTNSVVSLVPFYYKDAHKFYLDKKEIQNAFLNFDFSKKIRTVISSNDDDSIRKLNITFD